MTQQNISGALNSLAAQTNIPTAVIEEDETVEDTGKSTFDTKFLEVQPGVILDLEKAETLPKEQYLDIPGLFKGFEGPSPKAYTGPGFFSSEFSELSEVQFHHNFK